MIVDYKQAIKQGRKVYWQNLAYEVVHRYNQTFNEDEYLVKCTLNGSLQYLQDHHLKDLFIEEKSPS